MSLRTRLSDYFRQRDRGWMLSLFALVCLVYLPFLGNRFFFDDLNFFSGDMLDYYQHALFRLDLRWLPYASLGWTATLFSDVVPHFFHVGNVLLHAANVILLFYLLRQLLGAVVTQPEQGRAVVWGAWLAALLFAVHPVAVYAVGYVVQRSILMATLFVLLMQMAYLRGILTGQVRWLVLAVLCYFMAVFSKEHSVLAPAVLVAISILLREKNASSKRALWLTWVAFLVVAVLIALRANGVLGAPYEVMASALFEQQGVVASTPMLHLLSALTQAGLFFKYLLLWLLPNVSWMSVDMREPFVASLADWRGWLGAIAFVTYGVFAVRLLLRGGMAGLLGFALLYPWVLFGVELVGIRVQEPFVLYRSYLWMPGLMLVVPLLLLRFPQRRTTVIVGCVAIILVPLAWNRLWVFGDSYRMWNEAALLLKDERVAGADRIYFNRSQALMAAQKWVEAAQDLERSVAISPQLEQLHYALGFAYSKMGRNQEALVQYDAAIALNPGDANVYLAKGFTLKGLHRDKEAALQMEYGCRLKNQLACLIYSANKSQKK
jgi:protein O-mannosyl-transferase